MFVVSRKHTRLAASVLYSAFKDSKADNSINYVVKQDGKREKRLFFLMYYMVQKAQLYGEAYLSDDRKGCLLVQYPHRSKTSVRSMWLDLQLLIKTIGITRLFKILKRERHLKKHHPKIPHIHPWILGVEEGEKGKGMGSRLIREVFEAHTDNNLPIIIETTARSNIVLYRRFGFRVYRETEDLEYPLIYLIKDDHCK